MLQQKLSPVFDKAKSYGTSAKVEFKKDTQCLYIKGKLMARISGKTLITVGVPTRWERRIINEFIKQERP